MRRFASIVALFVLFSAALPMMACITASAMSPQEKACCHTMQDNCGQMLKQGCCRTEIQINEHPQAATNSSSMDLHWAVIDWLKPALVTAGTSPALQLSAPDEYSPPGLLTAKISVLRI
jgi:hypothetical protein